jgi:hypothetical protein
MIVPGPGAGQTGRRLEPGDRVRNSYEVETDAGGPTSLPV